MSSKSSKSEVTKLTNKDLKKIVKDLNDDNYSYDRDNIYTAFTFSVITASTLNNDLILDTNIDVDSLYDEKHKQQDPIFSIEEQTLKNIREQLDYVENKYYEGNYINYIIESSSTINKITKMTFLYNENHGGKGTLLEIL